jgi:hypothetical protein
MCPHLKPNIDHVGDCEEDGRYAGDGEDFVVEDSGGDDAAIVKGCVECGWDN